MNLMGKIPALALVLALGAPPLAPAEPRDQTGTPAIQFALDKLSVLGSVLMIAAHPDDENNTVLTYLARGRKIRTGYLSCTRGEGGQNLLGPEQSELLGVLRTQELLAARRLDGASQYFTRAIDFGFTKTKEEAIEKWGHERVLADMVWVIRQQQPDVVLLVFSGTPADGHGQHSASAVLGKEAFEVAGDPKRFPEQLKWVQAWKPRRLMQARFAGGPGRGGANVETPRQGAPNAPGQNPGRGGDPATPPAAPPQPPDKRPTITLQAGDYDPVLGRSMREISVLSRNEHKSQAMASTIAYGAVPLTLINVEGDLAKKDLFDGIDTSWSRVPNSGRVSELIAAAQRDFDYRHPEKTAAALLEARPLLNDLAGSGPAGAQRWAGWKLEELDHVVALCLGLHTEAQADAPAFVPGGAAKLQLTAINRSHLPVTLTGIHLSGWGNADAAVKAKALPYNAPEVTAMTLPVPATQPWSQPFWLSRQGNGNWYDISDQALIGRADIVPEVLARFDFTLNARAFSVTEPLQFRYAEPASGEFVRPIVVEPPVAVDLPSRNLVFVQGTPQEISLQVRALTPNQTGEFRFEVPAGFTAQPASIPFQLKEAGTAQELRFRVTPPAGAASGKFRAYAKVGSVEVATGLEVISYTHIPAQTVLEPTTGRISSTPLKVLSKRIGYVMGSSDSVPEGLRQMGCTVELLTEKELSSADLSVYDAIVTGVRAYSVRPDLRASQQRLLTYVANGGTMVVQYNNATDRRMGPSVAEALDHLGPYPFTLAGNNMRVTDENTPVEYVSTTPLLHVPNEITAADFEGWVQERGLYFAQKWDAHYETPLEMHDKGEAQLKGGLLYTKYGKGAYVFTALSFFRQFPAGVPGAYRLFANLISAGK